MECCDEDLFCGVDGKSVAPNDARRASSQDHFGALFRTERNESIPFAPRGRRKAIP